MNMHKGARLTPYSRDLLVRRITTQATSPRFEWRDDLESGDHFNCFA